MHKKVATTGKEKQLLKIQEMVSGTLIFSDKHRGGKKKSRASKLQTALSVMAVLFVIIIRLWKYNQELNLQYSTVELQKST